jgi:hypothetical protein
MLQVEFNSVLKLIGKGYSLSFHEDRPFVSLSGENGQLLAELFAYSGVHPLHTRDDAILPGVWEIEQTPELGRPSLYFATHIDATGEAPDLRRLPPHPPGVGSLPVRKRN